MTNYDRFKCFAAFVILGLSSLAQAQEIDSRWRLRIADTNNKVKVEATIRFLADAAGSCMSGEWKRALVETQTASDEKFFPLTEPLAYQLKNQTITLGRTEVCDGYLFLMGESNKELIRGPYELVSIGQARKLGSFTLEKLP